MKSSRSERIFFATLLLLTAATAANAYIDGATGSMLWQMLVAGVVGLAFVVKSSWGRLVAFCAGAWVATTLFLTRKSRSATVSNNDRQNG